MNLKTFTFDNTYFFDRRPADDCWYAFTHPMKDPFAHGYFDVASGLYASDPGDGRVFSDSQKREIEQILKLNKPRMSLDQFDIHNTLPSHYFEINKRSNRFADFVDRLKWASRTEPAFSIAYETLTQHNPAFRLTRDFVEQVFDEMEKVTSSTFDKWLHEVTQDTWTYDYSPAPNESYSDFFQLAKRRLTIPDARKIKITQDHKLYEIKGLPRLYLFEQHHEWGREARHYVDIGPVFAPTPLSRAYII